jgi:pyruvate carboxylase
MAATTPAAFDPAPRQLGAVIDCIAGAAILAGQVVTYNATGVDWTVEPVDSDTSLTAPCLGVALYSVASGAHVAIASTGSIVKVCESAGADIDAGDFLMAGAAAGCVITATDAADASILGIAVTDIAKNSTGYALIGPQYAAKGA